MKNKITYSKKNDILYPDLTLPEQKTTAIGKYGQLHLAYLKRHRRGTYTSLLTSGTLAAELAKIDAEARAEVALVLDRLRADRGITESLKATDPLRWAQEMNAAKHDAEEMVLREVIYK